MSNTVFLAIVAMLMSAPAWAQAPINPTAIAFDHVDHAFTDSYSVGYFSSATAPKPVQEAAFPKPATCMPCSGNLPSLPTVFQSWWVGVRAINGTATSGWSALVPFERRLLVPTNVGVK